MFRSIKIVCALMAIPLMNCTGFTVGYQVEKLDSDVWRVTYGGSPRMTEDTTQTRGLYRCATIALEQGYDGFEVLSDTKLDDPLEVPYSPRMRTQPNPALAYGPYNGGAVGYVVTGALIPDPDPFPVFSSDIKLVKRPFSGQPPKVFDAAALKAILDPYVNGRKKCTDGNICPHDHAYLHAAAGTQ